MTNAPADDDDAGAILREAAAALGWPEEAVAQLAGRMQADDPWREVVDRLRGEILPPTDRRLRLAVTAALYTGALRDGLPAPNEAVARAQSRSAANVRDDLKRARDSGLLTAAPGRGVPGGDLTAEAVSVLQAEIQRRSGVAHE